MGRQLDDEVGEVSTGWRTETIKKTLYFYELKISQSGNCTAVHHEQRVHWPARKIFVIFSDKTIRSINVLVLTFVALSLAWRADVIGVGVGIRLRFAFDGNRREGIRKLELALFVRKGHDLRLVLKRGQTFEWVTTLHSQLILETKRKKLSWCDEGEWTEWVDLMALFCIFNEHKHDNKPAVSRCLCEWRHVCNDVITRACKRPQKCLNSTTAISAFKARTGSSCVDDVKTSSLAALATGWVGVSEG